MFMKKQKTNAAKLLLGVLLACWVITTPLPGWAQSTVFTVPPEIPTHVVMSASGLNRITCPGPIRDVTIEEEKGLMVTYTGSTAIIKFPILKSGTDLIYADKPTELIAVCNDQIFSLIVTPKEGPGVIIQLTTGTKNRVEENQRLFTGLALEEKIVEIMRRVYKGAIPRSFKVKPINQKIELLQDIALTFVREISVDGEGFVVKEFSGWVRNRTEISWDEVEFLCALVSEDVRRERIGAKRCHLKKAPINTPTLLAWPIGITVDKHRLTTGETARILVVEEKRER